MVKESRCSHLGTSSFKQETCLKSLKKNVGLKGEKFVNVAKNCQKACSQIKKTLAQNVGFFDVQMLIPPSLK